MSPTYQVGHKLALLDKVAEKFFNEIHRIRVCLQLSNIGYSENDVSDLTAQEIIDKIREFIKSNPSDEAYFIFLHYLANYPVSMCKRDISPLLRMIMGLHYHLGNNGEKIHNGVKRITYDEIAQLFGRSKASVYDCVHKTEPLWQSYEEELREEEQRKKIEKARREKARQIAMEQLIEEEKKKLRKQQIIAKNQMNEQN